MKKTKVQIKSQDTINTKIKESFDSSNMSAYNNTNASAYDHKDAANSKAGKSVKHPLFKNVSTRDLKRGIIYSEVLGKPKGF